MAEAIVFDLDGTLINIQIDYDELFRKFRRIMKTEKIRPLTKTLPKLDQKTREALYEIWDKVEQQALSKITKNAEATAIFNAFSKAPKALVTMQGKAFVNSALETLGLSFDVLITREESLSRTEQLKKAIKYLQTSPQKTVFVGDTENDRRVARKLGCTFVKV